MPILTEREQKEKQSCSICPLSSKIIFVLFCFVFKVNKIVAAQHRLTFQCQFLSNHFYF